MREQDPVYRADFLDGAASRQAEIDRLEDLADRYYRFAFDDDRRPMIGAALAGIELESARELREPPSSVTTTDALASWGYPTPSDAAAEQDAIGAQQAGALTNRTSRRRAMSTRTITGNLAADPEAAQAGRVQIAKLRAIENTGEYRQGQWVEHDTPTTHFVEAKFELARNVLATLHRGDSVVVIGYERTATWGRDGQKQHGRVLDADVVAASLARATAQITSTPRPE